MIHAAIVVMPLVKMVLSNFGGLEHNKRINTRCARWGQKHVGSRRFARYCSPRVFARYAGVRPKEVDNDFRSRLETL